MATRYVYLLEVRRASRLVWRHCLVQRSADDAIEAGKRLRATMGAGHTCAVFRCIVDGEVWRSS